MTCKCIVNREIIYYMDWLNKIPNWIKIPIKILLPALAIFSGFIILASDELLKSLNLFEFEQQSGFIFAIIFLACVSLILCYIISYIIDIFVKYIKTYLIKKRMYNKFNDLPDVYKNTLIQIYRQPSKSLKMEASNSVAAYLTEIRAIDRSSLSEFGYVFDYFLQPWVIMSIERLIDEIRTHIKKLEKIINNPKNHDKKDSIQEELKISNKNLEYLTTLDESAD